MWEIQIQTSGFWFSSSIDFARQTRVSEAYHWRLEQKKLDIFHYLPSMFLESFSVTSMVTKATHRRRSEERSRGSSGPHPLTNPPTIVCFKGLSGVILS